MVSDFFATTAAIKILTSYNINIGIDTITWLGISGGVTIAANIKMMIIATLRYFLKNSGVTNPTLARKYTIIGISKTIPLAIIDIFIIDT